MCYSVASDLNELYFVSVNSVDRNKYQIHIPLPPKIDPTVTMMQVRNSSGCLVSCTLLDSTSFGIMMHCS